MGKIDLGMITCSTKFGGSAIDSTPVRDARIHCSEHQCSAKIGRLSFIVVYGDRFCFK